MLFQSFEFLIFLPLVFFSYWVVLKNNFKAQNVLLLLASYVFYGWWDWRFLSLIAFSSILDYLVASKIYFYILNGNKRKAKLFLWISLGANLGLLGFFKYYNFFTESAQILLNSMGFQVNDYSLAIILPVGISFYTFQTLSYSIDIYRGNLKPTNDPIAFFAFVSFFPQLVAGPIERASNLLPQFLKKRKFTYEQGKDGLLQIVSGLFKKLVIADTCAYYANLIFQSNDELSGSVLFLGTVYFAFQIYGDFSGYSDMAIGIAKLFGIRLMTNFRTPYFSRDISEFWRKWHISLSTWFRDYVYIPLGGSKVSRGAIVRNTFIIFILSGFWHGANWTFVIWGILNALYFLPLQLTGRNRRFTKSSLKGLPNLKEVIQILSTFFLVCVAWVFFRSESVTDAFIFLSNMFSKSLFTLPDQFRRYLPLLFIFIGIEWLTKNKDHILQLNKNFPLILKWPYYYSIFFAILYNLNEENVKFIYFDF